MRWTLSIWREIYMEFLRNGKGKFLFFYTSKFWEVSENILLRNRQDSNTLSISNTIQQQSFTYVKRKQTICNTLSRINRC